MAIYTTQTTRTIYRATAHDAKKGTIEVVIVEYFADRGGEGDYEYLYRINVAGRQVSVSNGGPFSPAAVQSNMLKELRENYTTAPLAVATSDDESVDGAMMLSSSAAALSALLLRIGSTNSATFKNMLSGIVKVWYMDAWYYMTDQNFRNNLKQSGLTAVFHRRPKVKTIDQEASNV